MVLAILAVSMTMHGQLSWRFFVTPERKVLVVVDTFANAKPTAKSWGTNRINLIGAGMAKVHRGQGLHWDDLHATPEKARAILLLAEAELDQVELDESLSPSGRAEKLKVIGAGYMAKLNALPTQTKAVERRRAALDERVAKDIRDATTVDSGAIRERIASTENPAMTVAKHKGETG